MPALTGLPSAPLTTELAAVPCAVEVLQPWRMAEDTRIGTEVAGYRIEEVIGRGGMGAVYLARHLRLGRMVALKLLAPELADNEKFRDRFLRESKIAASIDHPNIVPIYDADEADGVLFLAMRYVDGTDLRGLIASEGRIDPPRMAAIAQQLGDALDVAHGRGLVHRDVKPANVLITPRHAPTGRDHAYLSDFGLTKRALSVSGLTQTGQIVGTIDYVAPEQVKGDPVDGRADQYSMGCLLYQCLTGSVPFPRDIEVAVLWAHVQDRPPSLAEAGFGKQVDAAIGKALAKEPKDRYETCGELASAFSEAVGVTSRPGRVRRVRPKLAPGRQARGPAPVRLVRRHPAMAIVVALALVAAVAVPTTIALRGGGSGEAIVGDAVALIDLESEELMDAVSLDSRPGDIAVGAGGVWVTLPDRGDVVRIDPETMTVRNTIPVGANPSGIAIGAGSVWVTNGGSSTVSRISPETEQVVGDPIDVPGGPAGIAVGLGGVWVANSFAASVSRIDPNSGTVQATIPVGDRPVDLTIDEDGLWVADARSGIVSLVDPDTSAVRTVDVGSGPLAIAAGPEGIWVAKSLDGTIKRIDPDTVAVARTIDVGGAPSGLDAGSGVVVVSDESQGSVTTIDPASRSASTITVGSQAGDMAVGDGVVWVSVRGSEAAHRGGALTVWGDRARFDTLDPALAYDWISYGILQLTNDGLVGFRHTGGLEGTTLVPDLARSLPDATNGGRTYTFDLRPGIRYSNGDPVQPEDFRRAIERVFGNLDRYGGASGGVAYFSGIVGADDCTPGKPCDLSDGIVADDNTVTFNLSAPDPDFVYALTLPFAFAVPAETPDALANGASVPATGPYVVETFTEGKEIVLGRNPRFRPWDETVRPDGFPDHIVWRLGTNLRQMAAKVLHGDADLMFTLPEPETSARLASNRAGQLQLATPQPATFFMSLDTHAPPFDDPKVRRALNFAVDRRKVQELFGNGTRPACQVMPPNFPGYVPYCPYTRHPDGTWTRPDLKEAHRLVNESRTTGMKVTVWTAPCCFPPVAYYFRDLLAELGYQATLKAVDNDTLGLALYGRPRRAQIALGGEFADYAAESGFIPPIARCGAPYNSSGFCDHDIDRRMKRAAFLQITDPAAAHRLWSSIEHDIMDVAPWVPLVDRFWVNVVSDRLENYQVNPQWGPLVDQMWVR
jgi:YVTN family beta-propeller protein